MTEVDPCRPGVSHRWRTLRDTNQAACRVYKLRLPSPRIASAVQRDTGVGLLLLVGGSPASFLPLISARRQATPDPDAPENFCPRRPDKGMMPLSARPDLCGDGVLEGRPRRARRPNVMDAFGYVSVIISVVIGLGLSHLLTGAVELFKARRRVRFYWVHLLWVALTFVGHILHRQRRVHGADERPELAAHGAAVARARHGGLRRLARAALPVGGREERALPRGRRRPVRVTISLVHRALRAAPRGDLNVGKGLRGDTPRRSTVQL